MPIGNLELFWYAQNRPIFKITLVPEKIIDQNTGDSVITPKNCVIFEFSFNSWKLFSDIIFVRRGFHALKYYDEALSLQKKCKNRISGLLFLYLVGTGKIFSQRRYFAKLTILATYYLRPALKWVFYENKLLKTNNLFRILF